MCLREIRENPKFRIALMAVKTCSKVISAVLCVNSWEKSMLFTSRFSADQVGAREGIRP